MWFLEAMMPRLDYKDRAEAKSARPRARRRPRPHDFEVADDAGLVGARTP
jgi:hypothetical protein